MSNPALARLRRLLGRSSTSGRAMRPSPLDLFGEVPITLADVLAWMLAVPEIPPTSRRFGPYVRVYQVLEKIQAAKLEGTFDEIVAAPARPPPYRLAAAIDAAQAARRRFSRGRG